MKDSPFPGVSDPRPRFGVRDLEFSVGEIIVDLF